MKLLKLAQLYLCTIVNLKPIQVYYRIWFKVYSPYLDFHIDSLRKRAGIRNGIIGIPKNISMLSAVRFCFLNHAQDINYSSDWNNGQLPKLWVYNLNYFDDLNGVDANQRREWHINLVDAWIDANQIGIGISSEPYPTSLRIINWVKSDINSALLNEKALQNLYLQVRWLNLRIEWHILGNHLLANAKALIFAGLFFQGEEADAWLVKGVSIWSSQLEEQILSDGAHFELSPMYHSIVLEDILDVISIAKNYPEKFPEGFLLSLNETVAKMLTWMKSMIHQDGSLSFFNDVALEIAPKYSDLLNYAASLGLSPASIEHVGSDDGEVKLILMHDSAYIRANCGDFATLIMDVGEVGPKYLAGHAHADTLSYEFSAGGKRLIVNGGISTYERCPQRELERSTKQHSTLTIDNQNSSEVWAAFRVGKRAHIHDLEIYRDDKRAEVRCSHDGFSRGDGLILHSRKWAFEKTTISIRDVVRSPSKLVGHSLISRVWLHPAVRISTIGMNSYRITDSDGLEVSLNVKCHKSTITNGVYASDFGKLESTSCLELELDINNPVCEVNIYWD